MAQPIELLNLIACGLLSTAAMWAVMSPRVRDGIVIKSGLILLSIGFAAVGAALAQERTVTEIGRALSLVHAGLLTVVVGIFLRWKKTGRVYRIDEWINPPTVEVKRAERDEVLDLEDAQRGSRL